jgi:retinol dehydrogenase-12
MGSVKRKCSEVAEQIQSSTGNPVEWIAADLSTLSGIKATASQFTQNHNQLNILINNAGALFNRHLLTQDGFEMTFAFNHLNYFLFTHELLDLIKSSQPARIINVSSLAHASLTEFDFDNLQGEKSFNGWIAYSRSKLCNLFFTYELARSLKRFDINVNALHPGYVDSGLGMNNGYIFKLFAKIGAKVFAKRPRQGAEISIYLATSLDVKGISSKYFSACRETPSSKISYDETLSAKLWQRSMELNS